MSLRTHFMSADEKKSLYLKEATDAYQGGQEQAALTAVTKLLKLDPNQPKALEIKGFIANQKQDWTTAIDAWSRLFEVQPHRPGPLNQAVSAYIAAQNFEAGRSFAQRAVTKAGDQKAATVELMRLLSAMGRTDEAGELVPVVWEHAQETKSYPVALQLARWFRECERLEEAEETFLKCKEFDATRIDPDIYLARLYYVQNRFEEARDLWQSILDDPRYTAGAYEPRVFMGRMCFTENNFEEAREHFIAAKDANPRQIEPYRTLINISMQLRDDEFAEKMAEEFRSRFPENGESLLLLAQIAERRRDSAEADGYWMELFDKFPHSSAWDIQYDRYLVRNGRPGDALAFWELREAQGHISKDSMYQRASHLYDLGRKAQALKVLENELKPASIPDENGILLHANALRDLNIRDRAVWMYVDGSKAFPRNPTFWEGAITIFLDSDDLDQVKSMIAEAEQHFDPEKADDAYALARIYRAAELRSKSEEMLKKVLEIDPEHDRGRRLMMQMLDEQGRVYDAAEHAEHVRLANRYNLQATKIMTKAAILRYNSIQVAPGETATDSVIRSVVNRAPAAQAITGPRRALIATSSLGSGGAERQVAYTCKSVELDDKIQSLAVVAEDLNSINKRDFFRDDIEAVGTEVFDFAEMGRDELAREVSARFPEYRDELALLRTLQPEVTKFALPFYSWLRLHPTEVVHLWQDTINIAGGLAAVLAGVPRIILATRSTRPDSRRRLRPYLEPGYKALMSRPEVVMINNSTSGARDYEDWLGLAEGEIGVLPNGMDVAAMRQRATNPEIKAKIAKELGFVGKGPILGGVMRFTEEKRPELFVEVAMNAARRDPNVNFVLVGDGPMRAELIRTVERAGLSARIVLPGAQRPVEPWMDTFDMLFLTSRMEGLPNVLLEAQCLGTPVASMRVGGAPEALVDGVTGVLFDEVDVDYIASELLLRLRDESWMKSASAAGRARIENEFSNEVMGERTRTLYLG